MWGSRQAAWRPNQGFVRGILALLDFRDHQCSESPQGLGSVGVKGLRGLRNEDDSWYLRPLDG